jgi:hypothetical protein
MDRIRAADLKGAKVEPHCDSILRVGFWILSPADQIAFAYTALVALVVALEVVEVVPDVGQDVPVFRGED